MKEMKDSTCSETEIATKPDSTTGTTQLAVGGTFEMESGIIGYKFPFGKVDAADVPNDYVPPPINIVDGDIADCSDEETMIMTIPSSDFKTVCLFHGNIQKRSFLSIPDFPAPLPQAPSPHARYRITASTNHGLGMFATQDIALGDLVLAERPLLVVPQAIIVHNGDYFNNPDLTPSQRTAIQLSNVERLLTHTISRMQPQDRESFFELHNSHTEDGSGPIYGRVRTNGIAFSIDEKYRQPDDEGYYIDDEWTFENSGMFLDISRVNHSCTPNVIHRFDSPSFSLRLHAIRPIKAGEELFISYTTHTDARSTRQQSLLPYGFNCSCSACQDPTWDTRLTLIQQSAGDSDTWAQIPKDKLIRDSLRWIKVIETAKLESLYVYHKHLVRLVTALRNRGRWDEARKYAELDDAWYKAKHGRSFLAGLPRSQASVR